MNQAMEFGLIFAGGILLTSALTGSSLSDIAKGHPQQIGTSGQTLGGSSAAGQVAANGVAGVGQAATGILRTLFPSSAVTVERRDQGRDLMASPNSNVIAPGAGYLLRVASDPHGFGDAYPIVHFTTGPWAGQDVYFGHTLSALLTPGQKFNAGDPISVTQNGRGPYVGNATQPGWVEIGLAPGGRPGPFGGPLPAGL